MKVVPNASIQRQLRAIMMLTSGAALLIASLGFVAYDLILIRASMVTDLRTLAEMVANLNTAALTFDDRKTAGENLSSLREKRNIISALIYEANGNLFAAFPQGANPGPLPPADRVQRSRFEEEFLEVIHPVILQRDILGYVVLRSDLEPMYSRLQQYVGIVLLLMLISAALAYAISARLQKVISIPILELARTARGVSDAKNYSVRVPSADSAAEIEQLITAFNDMLGQIQVRDAALERARETLEKRVEERTAELKQQMEERSRAEDALRASEVRFRSLVHSAHDAIIISDGLGRIISWNRGAQSMFQYDPGEMQGRLITSIIPERYREAHFQALQNAEHNEPGTAPSAAIELHGRRRDGSEFPIELSISTWRTGDALFYSSIIRDITERKQAVEKLTAVASKLERSNRELQDFAYVASHDLQEPLRKVQAFGDRLKMKFEAQLGTEGRDYLERMQNAAARMQSLINDLLLFSRVNTRTRPFERVILNQIVKEVLGDLEIRIQQTKGEVLIGSLPELDADPLQMRQLFQNLIGNALKFHRPDASPVVRVEGRMLAPGERPGTDPVRDFYQITVSDNGIGFDEKYLPRIFTVFQRLHGRGTYEGTGIGLAICRKIAERHGGSITARSEPGRGATFIVTLPATQPKAESV